MRLTFLGKDSRLDESPTLFVTDRGSYVVQEWIVTDPEILAVIEVSDGETVVEVPAALMAHLAKDGLSRPSCTSPRTATTSSGDGVRPVSKYPGPPSRRWWASRWTA
ncbi:MAG: hypothetical protein JO272_10210 [Pseudonocardiales bacterium]|nr:hypothetical protein [Pseudonocardiales bacterium]